MAEKDLFFKLLEYEKLYAQSGTQSKDEFQRERLALMREAHKELCKVGNQGIRNTTYYWKSAFTFIFASLVFGQERDQASACVMYKLFNFVEASIAFKKFRKYHCAPCEDATTMTLVRFDVVITEPADSFKSHNDMKNMYRIEIRTGVECKIELGPIIQQKWSSGKGGKIHLQSSGRLRKLLPIAVTSILDVSQICIGRATRENADGPHSEIYVGEHGTEKRCLNNEIR